MTNELAIRIHDRRPFADSEAFGAAGAYERLVGRVHHKVDPAASAQAGVTDIALAERGTDGLVHFTADVCILKPMEMARGNRRLFFDWGNRGNKRMLQYFNDAQHSNDPLSRVHAGNDFLMRRGYTVVFGSWQGDLLPGDGRMMLDLPVARQVDGAPVTGLVRTEFIASEPGVTCYPLSGRGSTRSHPTVSLDTANARLTRRRYAQDERQPVPSNAWSFARIEAAGGLDGLGADRGIAPSYSHIYLPAGFEIGWIYELVYEARDPLVMGLGHVAVRDLVSFLKFGERDADGQANPLGPALPIEKAYGWGRSQTGRCIRDFIWRGFNEDARGRRVFDGLMPHVAGAGGKWLNQRFANAVVAGGQQHEDHYSPADRFPFAYSEVTDRNSGRTDAILKRPATDPLVIHSQTATEYWQRRGSLVHTDSEGNDLPEPEGVRIYHWSSTQHTSDPNQREPRRSVTDHYLNVTQTSMLFRAALDAMDRWATDGTPPPPSRYPQVSEGTLVRMEAWVSQFPRIPGIRVPQEPNQLPFMDFGREEHAGVLSQEPPAVCSERGYAVLVPAVDEDGNEIAGVRCPMVQAPLGTYTGWNIRARGFGEGAMHEFSGGYIPFPEDDAVRYATADPRRSILDRYGSAEGYVAAIEKACRELVAEGFMLEEDIERSVRRAADWCRPLHDVRLSAGGS
jgi:hypothetical protein